jgi:hypothetical protein
MYGFDPFWFFFWFISLLYLALRDGEKTSHIDEDIDDYWSDG